MPTDHSPQCHIPTVLEYLQGWRPHHLPGQLCRRITTLYEKKLFLISNLNLPLVQLEAIISHPITTTWKQRLTHTHHSFLSGSCRKR